MEGKLRLGLLLASFRLPAWERLMLEKVKQSGEAQIVLVVLKEPPSQGFPGRKMPFLYRVYRRVEDWLSHPIPNALTLQDASELLKETPVIRVPVERRRDGEWLDSGSVAQVRQYGLDILLQTGFTRPRGEIYKAARLGVWYYHPGEGNRMGLEIVASTRDQPPRNSPAGFWEVFEGRPVTGYALYQAVDDLDPGRMLYQSYSATDPLSVNGNCNRFLWKSASFVPRALNTLRHSGEIPVVVTTPEKATPVAAQSTPGSGQPSAGTRPASTGAMALIREEIPGNAVFASLLARNLLRYASNRLAKLSFHTQWHLFYGFPELASFVNQAASQTGSDPTAQFAGFKRLSPPRPAFWSDPFVVYRDGLYYLFFEEFIYQKNKAHISMMILGEDGIKSGSTVVLEKPYHLSYPFIFEWEGSLYMLPETAAHRAIEVYRCREFPYRWEFHQTLMEPVKALDTTLFPYQGRWWMFTNLEENEGASSWDELFLFSADHPLSARWTPHPRNPVVSDVRQARPAGAIFELDGVLYRPSQDSSQGYGYGLNINRILTLNESDYREEVVRTIVPGRDRRIRGLHTFNQAGRMLVIDGKSRRLRFP
jgi:hypothetical protein